MENMVGDTIGSWDALRATDPEVYAAIEAEEFVSERSYS